MILLAIVFDIRSLTWLGGDWHLKNGSAAVEEHWTQPSANMMIGMGRTVENGKTVFFEYLRIEARPDGLYYVAQPKGQPPTDFKAIELSADRVVFANPQHDFPKRILYRKNADGSVTARVEGDPGSKAEEYAYKRPVTPR